MAVDSSAGREESQMKIIHQSNQFFSSSFQDAVQAGGVVLNLFATLPKEFNNHRSSFFNTVNVVVFALNPLSDRDLLQVVKVLIRDLH